MDEYPAGEDNCKDSYSIILVDYLHIKQASRPLNNVGVELGWDGGLLDDYRDQYRLQ
jgi:hypothetical protein